MQDLLFEVSNVCPVGLLHFLRISYNAVRMGFRISRHCYSKVVSIMLPAAMFTFY